MSNRKYLFGRLWLTNDLFEDVVYWTRHLAKNHDKPIAWLAVKSGVYAKVSEHHQSIVERLFRARYRGGKIGSDGYVAWGLKFKKDDEEENKLVMISSMLLTFRKNKCRGTGDSELDKNLAHDLILTSLARLSVNVKKGSKKKNESLSAIKRQIEHYDLPEIEADRFKKIIDAISGNHEF